MEETNESAMGIGGDGVSDNTEQGKTLNLSEFPKELLEQILIHLDDEELLTSSHVCRSFAFAVESTFAQKYSKDRYFICDTDKETSYYKVMLTKYGEKIRAIHVDFQDEELIAIIEQKCCNLKSAHFIDITNVPQLKGLKKITLQRVNNLNRVTFGDMINGNHQLETLHIEGIESDLLAKLDGRLDMLKSLTLCDVRSDTYLPKLNLKSLEILNINAMYNSSCTHLFRALNCNAIKVLSLERVFVRSAVDEEIINEICSFKTLVSLRFYKFPCSITENQLRKLAVHLPHLTDFSVETPPDLPNLKNEILSVLSILSKLTKLTISLFKCDYKKVLKDLEESIDVFHACFATTNTEVEIINRCNKVSTAKDRIFVCKGTMCGIDSIELHWMDNLNEASVRKVIGGFSSWTREFKFVNHCADQTFDISTFMHSNFKNLETLHITSNGPIAVNCINANATRHPEFFPHLQSLYIHLKNHSAIDVLRKFKKNYSKKIVDLQLNTKSVPENHEVEQEGDASSVLAQFENLDLNSPFSKLNTDHMLLVCHKLRCIICKEWKNDNYYYWSIDEY